MTVSKITNLKINLTKSTKEWLNKFIDLKGLDALESACFRLEKPKADFKDLICQTQLILCIKAIMNNETALDTVISHDVAAIDSLLPLMAKSANVLMKIQVGGSCKILLFRFSLCDCLQPLLCILPMVTGIRRHCLSYS
jgi:hypothetical protein